METASRLLTGPTVEPVTLAEVKRHCNVVTTDEDTLLTTLIQAAREYVEEATSRALINQTWVAQFSGWPCDGFCLRRPPLVSVTHIKYWDVDDVLQTLPTTHYEVDTVSQPGRIWWDADQNNVLPVLDTDAFPVIVTYVAGYGAAAANVPARAKQAILLLVGHWYKNREAVGRVEGEVALAFGNLVKSLKVGVYP